MRGLRKGQTGPPQFFGARGVSLAGRAQRLTTIFSKRLLKDNVAHLLIVSIAAAVSCERPGLAGVGGGAMAASFLAALQAVEKDTSRVRDTRLARAVRAKTHAAARATSALQSLVRDTSQVVQDAAVRRRDLLVIDSEKAVASTPCVSGRGKYKVWTAPAMLKACFGRIPTGAKVGDKSPTQFSGAALAYWMSGSTTRVKRVRDAVAWLWLCCQKHALSRLLHAPARADVLSVSIMWDETKQMLRLREATSTRERGAHPVLAMHFDFVARIGSHRAAQPVIVAPAVLPDNTAAAITAAIHDRFPELEAMPSKGRWFILRTLSDRHASNPLVESHYISKLGSCGNALVLPHWCNIHQLNLCSSRTLRVNQAVVPLKAICVGLTPPLRHRESGGSAGCCRALKCRRGQARGTFLRIILLAQGFRQPANESCPSRKSLARLPLLFFLRGCSGGAGVAKVFQKLVHLGGGPTTFRSYPREDVGPRQRAQQPLLPDEPPPPGPEPEQGHGQRVV